MAREGLPIELTGLTKWFGPVHAVTDMTFTVHPGRVTGFLGPNGAGKTTTLRCILGLVSPTRGHATIGGRAYRDLDDPIGTVGAVLESASFHPGRSARNHLRVMARAAGVPAGGVEEVLALVALTPDADRRVGGYSLGMRQRLALAAALLAEPPVLLLDEPANGLDPAGIAWLREFLRRLAGEGRTVLVSSHVLSEVQQTVEDVLIIANGRLVRQGTLADLEDPATRGVVVRSPNLERLRSVLRGAGFTEEGSADGTVRVVGSTTDQVGAVAFAQGVELHELYAEPSDLERTFLELTTEGAV
jgi:ABC-2 type transport system ATP-binding protein